MIAELKTVADYEKLTEQNGVRVVHFGFRWNSFDRTMMRTLFELKPEFSDKIEFGFVDIDNNATIELLQRINLVNSPTLIYFRNGEHLATHVGMRPMDEIRQRIQTLLEAD
ncbi:MAG: thioredoxin family protein [Acidobacteriota bacterium]|nr:thioredoxin family protein [Acidobacteriota bacterium]